MGGIPTNYHGEVVTLENGNADSVDSWINVHR